MRRPRPEAPDLRLAQQEFLNDLTGRKPRSEAARAAAFRRPRRASVEDRWHVYAHGYLARIGEAAGLEYAAVRRILGTDAFEAMLGRYLAVFPPRSFDLSRVGDRLPGFLEFDRLSVELPFLPDLARLERAIAGAFVAADGEPAHLEALRRRSSEELLALGFGLLPGVALVRSCWPLDELWSSRFEVDDDAVSIRLEGRPSNVLVFRRDGRVRVERVSEAEAQLVEAASCGDVTLTDLPELTGAADDADGFAGLVAAFRSLAERDVFVIHRSTGWTGGSRISQGGTSMTPRSKSLLAAALAGALSLPAALSAQDAPAPGEEDKLNPCWGINKCKGTGDCGAEGCRHSGCHGSNACRGQGFLRLESETCLKIQGGSLTKAGAKPAAKKSEKKPS